MKKIINPHMLLLTVGVLQPASAQEIRGFFENMFREGGLIPPLTDFEAALSEQETANRILRVNSTTIPYYSLTLLGTLYLPADQRKKRDKFRAYLLRDSHRDRYILSRESGTELTGASPVADASSPVKGRAASKLGRAAFGRRFADGRPYWPRIQVQFARRTGLTRRSRDTFPDLLSFASREQAQSARGEQMFFDYVGLGLCLGLSPQLIWNISREQHKHYRRFEIKKRDGGSRQIESPRVFLKVIQWSLSDFVLDNLPVHDAVHSFSIKRSIATNANPHVGKNFVGNVDIENFFGTISEDMVIRHLSTHGFNAFESVTIAKLSTNSGALPQGAPTSPVISNSILFDLDTKMHAFCDARHMFYTRYADDITISGGVRALVVEALEKTQAELGSLGFKLNDKKTRIASSFGQQRVTGVVVNVRAAPSRVFRRRARATFHNASINVEENVGRISELGGLLGYLKIFSDLRETQHISAYEGVLEMLKKAKAASKQAPESSS